MEQTGKISTPKEWIENIWYHYKWMIITGVVLAVFIIMAVVQLVSNKSPDVSIMYIGDMVISREACDRLESTVGTFSADYNDDGKINVNVLDITVSDYTDSQTEAVYYYDMNAEGTKRFTSEVAAGDSIIYVLEKPYFEKCIEEGVLTPLDEVIDDADMPENVISGYGVKISDLDAYQLEGIGYFPKDAVICLRRSPESEDLSYGRTQSDWEGNKRTFVNIIKYKAENQE